MHVCNLLMQYQSIVLILRVDYYVNLMGIKRPTTRTSKGIIYTSREELMKKYVELYKTCVHVRKNARWRLTRCMHHRRFKKWPLVRWCSTQEGLWAKLNKVTSNFRLEILQLCVFSKNMEHVIIHMRHAYFLLCKLTSHFSQLHSLKMNQNSHEKDM